MNTIEKVVESIKLFSQIDYELEDGRLRVDPKGEDGFSVSMEYLADEILVGYGGWHEHFQNEKDAIACFMFGLTDQCRLKVSCRGDVPCKWTLEAKDGEQWEADSTVGSLIFPFWRKKTVKYLQNATIPASDVDSLYS